MALEFVGGSITSQSLGETDRRWAASGAQAPTTPTRTRRRRSSTRSGVNPWVDQADFDHHGYGIARVSSSELKVTFRRMKTIKKRSRDRLPDLRWTVTKGQRSLF